jgi:hypothetical protein
MNNNPNSSSWVDGAKLKAQTSFIYIYIYISFHWLTVKEKRFISKKKH